MLLITISGNVAHVVLKLLTLVAFITLTELTSLCMRQMSHKHPRSCDINVSFVFSPDFLANLDNNKNSPDSGYPENGDLLHHAMPNGHLDPDKGFYENLPFHGGSSQQQPQKQVSK